MKRKRIFLAFFMTFAWCSLVSAQDGVVTSQDFKTIVGCWKGSLTYADYSTAKPYTMPADLNVSEIANSGKFIFSNIYPDEPKANSSDTIIISSDRTRINDETVKFKRTKPDGTIEIVTEIEGIDGNDNQPAVIRHTYNFGGGKFSRRKDVQFKGKSEWLNRHEYGYTIKPCN